MLFQDLTMNNTFSLGDIRHVSMDGCLQIKIELASKVEKLFITDTSEVTVLDGAMMTNLELFSVNGSGRSKSDQTKLTIEANTQNWASETASLSLSNVTLISLPKEILLKSLTLVESFIENFAFENSTPGIEEIKVLNSSIANVTSLRSLYSITINKQMKQMTFENNIIESSCSTCEKDEGTCFIDPIHKYTNNSLPCDQCEQCGCDKGKIFFSYMKCLKLIFQQLPDLHVMTI